MLKVLAAKLFSIKLCYLSALSWHLYTLLIDGRADVTINNSQQTCRYADHTDVKCHSGTTCCNAVCAHYQSPPNDSLQGRCVPSCPENTIGLLLYRLVITNAIIINGCDVGRGLILKHCSEQAYDPPDVVLTVIENQVLVWLGSAMAPLLPLLGALSNVLHFTTQKLLAMHCFVPPLKPYSASRTSTIAHGLMLVALAGCAVTNGFNLQYHRRTCGPHQGTSMKNAFGDLIQAAPRGLSTTVTWFASPIVLGGLAVLLLFCIVVLQSRVAKFRRDVHRLKEDFISYRRDMKEKVMMTRKLGATGQLPLLPPPSGGAGSDFGSVGTRGGATADATYVKRLQLVATSQWGPEGPNSPMLAGGMATQQGAAEAPLPSARDTTLRAATAVTEAQQSTRSMPGSMARWHGPT